MSTPRLRRVSWTRSFALLGTLALAGTSQADSDARAPIRLISPQRLVEWIQTSPDSVIFVDVREPEEFAENHIPGAINIPQRDFAARASEIPQAKLVIPYCNMDFRGFVAVRELEALGVRNLTLMQERGINGWRNQGLPVAGPETGLTDAQGLERLRSADPQTLLGERYTPRVGPTGVTREINMTASEWYFEPNDLEVNAGDEVRITIQTQQGNHFFIQPDFEIAATLDEGSTQEVVFLADRAGDFRFGSCEWDGSVLQVMKGRLRVRAPAQ